MKKKRTLALLLAGILTASALTMGASAEETEPSPQAGIEQEETAPAKKTKKSADISAEDGAVKEKKTKKSADSASEDGTAAEKKAKKSSDSASETGTAKKKHSKVSSKTTVEPEGVIGKDAAKEAALADAGAQAEGHVRGRYTEKDGTGIYKVTFRAGGQRYKYRIDAVTGEILEKSVTEITE